MAHLRHGRASLHFNAHINYITRQQTSANPPAPTSLTPLASSSANHPAPTSSTLLASSSANIHAPRNTPSTTILQPNEDQVQSISTNLRRILTHHSQSSPLAILAKVIKTPSFTKDAASDQKYHSSPHLLQTLHVHNL